MAAALFAPPTHELAVPLTSRQDEWEEQGGCGRSAESFRQPRECVLRVASLGGPVYEFLRRRHGNNVTIGRLLVRRSVRALAVVVKVVEGVRMAGRTAAVATVTVGAGDDGSESGCICRLGHSSEG